MNDKINNIVVGAGIGGLSISYELSKKFSENTILVEKTEQVGGLCKSIKYNGCILDLGSHVFYGHDLKVKKKIKEIVDESYWLNVVRNGQLCVDKNFISWPFKLKSIFELPINYLINICISLIIKKIKKKKIIKNYDDVIDIVYGSELKKIFFKPLTEKFLKVNSESISPDWAIASIRAATKIKDKDYMLKENSYITNINESLQDKNYSLIKFFISSVINRNKEPFYYFKDGYGRIVTSYEEKLLNLKNFELKKKSEINKIIIKNNFISEVAIENKIYNVKNLIWTGGIYSLCKLLEINSPKVNYMHSVFVYIFLNSQFKTKFDMCYFSDKDIIFQRASLNCEHSKYVINNKKIKSFACFELSFKNELDIDNLNYNYIKSRVIEDCKKLNMFDDRNIIDTHIIKAKYSYPIFDLHYRNEINEFKKKIANYKNLYLLGRQGSFGYENADLVINEVLNHKLFVK